MVEREAIEASSHQISGDRPADMRVMKDACLLPRPTLVDDPAESILIHQRNHCATKLWRQSQDAARRGGYVMTVSRDTFSLG